MSILAGLYGFKQGDYFAGFEGSVEAGLSRMGHVKNALQTLQYVNKQDLQIYNHTVYFDDGTVVTVWRNWNRYTAEVSVPSRSRLDSSQFYWVPGCVARYDVINSWENSIPTGDLKKYIIARGSSVTTESDHTKQGLPATAFSNGNIIHRNYGVINLPGDKTSSSSLKSVLQFSSEHIPSDGDFSISCVVRLNKEIEIDYSFSEKTDETDCGYVIYNPIKPRILSSSDGNTWSALCPGSLAPIIGTLVPSRFTNHYVNETFPWPTYNNNFVSSEKKQIGLREIATTCENEPLLVSDYSSDSPYWDKVTAESLETLECEFDSWWDENSEIANKAPYASFCKLTISGNHTKSIGTRAVRTLESGEKRYSTVGSCSYDTDSDVTTFILKDWQYKLYIAVSNGIVPIVFGDQAFPVCHPRGYMIGINFIGLMFFNGNRILAGKISDFQSEYKYDSIVSGELEIGSWYHVCMSYKKTDDKGNESGETALYITRLGADLINKYNEILSTKEFINQDGFGNTINHSSGGQKFVFSPDGSSKPTDYQSSWIYSADMDIGLPRFYHRSINAREAKLLLLEAFNGVFVADDFEVCPLQAAGYTPVTV